MGFIKRVDKYLYEEYEGYSKAKRKIKPVCKEQGAVYKIFSVFTTAGRNFGPPV
jgi:hypothetical protein